MRRERLGPLDAVIAGEPSASGDAPVVVLLHGFGASGEDLVPLARYFDAPEGTSWVFPAAPLELGGLYGDARAWWLIDFERLERDLMSGRAGDRAVEVPDGLVEARAAMTALLDDVRAR